MDAVRANVRDGKPPDLARQPRTCSSYWGQVDTETPFFFPNREALLELFADIVNTPGVEQHLLSHCTDRRLPSWTLS